MQNARTSTVRAQTVEKPWRVQEGRSSLELLIVPGSVYGGRGAIESGRKSHFPEQNWREGAAGSFLSRPTALSKKPHATLQCSFRLSKTFAEFERVEILSIFQLYPAAYTSGRDDLCGRKSHFPEQNWREGAAGSLPSSLTALSKKPHATLQCGFRLSKTFAEFERVEILSIFQLYPAACTAGAGRLKAAENLIFQSKTGERAQQGACPPDSLVKSF